MADVYLLVNDITEIIHAASDAPLQVPVGFTLVETTLPVPWPNGTPQRCLWQDGAIIADLSLSPLDEAEEAAVAAMSGPNEKTIRDALWQVIAEGGLTILDPNSEPPNEPVTSKAKCLQWLKGLRKGYE
jgi:hypothetical protein